MSQFLEITQNKNTCKRRQFSGESFEVNDEKSTTTIIISKSENTSVAVDSMLVDKSEQSHIHQYAKDPNVATVAAQRNSVWVSNLCGRFVVFSGILLFITLLVLDVFPTRPVLTPVTDKSDVIQPLGGELRMFEEFLHMAEESLDMASAAVGTMDNDHSDTQQQQMLYYQSLFSIFRTACHNALLDIALLRSTTDRLKASGDDGKALRLSKGSIIYRYTNNILAVGYYVTYQPLKMALHFIIVNMLRLFLAVLRFGFHDFQYYSAGFLSKKTEVHLFSSPSNIMSFPFPSCIFSLSSSDVDNKDSNVPTIHPAPPMLKSIPLFLKPKWSDKHIDCSDCSHTIMSGRREWSSLTRALSCVLGVADLVQTYTGKSYTWTGMHRELLGDCEDIDRYAAPLLYPTSHTHSKDDIDNVTLLLGTTSDDNICAVSHIYPSIFPLPSLTTEHLTDNLLLLLKSTDGKQVPVGSYNIKRGDMAPTNALNEDAIHTTDELRKLENLELNYRRNYSFQREQQSGNTDYGNQQKQGEDNKGNLKDSDALDLERDIIVTIEAQVRQDRRLLNEEMQQLVLGEILGDSRARRRVVRRQGRDANLRMTSANGSSKGSHSEIHDEQLLSRRLQSQKKHKTSQLHNGEGILAVLPVRSGRKLPFHNIKYLIKMHADMVRAESAERPTRRLHTDHVNTVYTAAEVISRMPLSVVVPSLDNLDLYNAVRVLMKKFSEENKKSVIGKTYHHFSTVNKSVDFQVQFDGRWRKQGNITIADDYSLFDLSVRPLRLRYPVRKPPITMMGPSSDASESMKSPHLSNISSLVSYCTGHIAASIHPISTGMPLMIVQLSSKRLDVKTDHNTMPKPGDNNDHIVQPSTDSSWYMRSYDSSNRKHRIIHQPKPKITISQSYALLVHLGILVAERRVEELLRTVGSSYDTQRHPYMNKGNSAFRVRTSLPVHKYTYYIVIDESRVLHVPPSLTTHHLSADDTGDTQLISSLLFSNTKKKGSESHVNELLYNFMSVLLEPILSIHDHSNSGTTGSSSIPRAFTNIPHSARNVAFASQCTTFMSKPTPSRPYAHIPLTHLTVHDQGFSIGQQAVPVIGGTLIPVPVRRLYGEKAVSRGALLIAESFREPSEGLDEGVFHTSHIGNHMKNIGPPRTGAITANIDLLSPYCFAISRDAFEAADGFLSELVNVYKTESTPFMATYPLSDTNAVSQLSSEFHGNHHINLTHQREGHESINNNNNNNNINVGRYPFPSFGALAHDLLSINTYEDEGQLDGNKTDENITMQLNDKCISSSMSKPWSLRSSDNMPHAGNDMRERLTNTNDDDDICKTSTYSNNRDTDMKLLQFSSIYRKALSKRSEEELGWHLSIRLFDAWKRTTVTDATQAIACTQSHSNNNNRDVLTKSLSSPLWPIVATGARVVKLPSDMSLPDAINDHKFTETHDFLSSFVIRESSDDSMDSKDVINTSYRVSRHSGIPSHPSNHGTRSITSSILSLFQRIIKTTKAVVLSTILDPLLKYETYRKERSRLKSIEKHYYYARKRKKRKLVNVTLTQTAEGVTSNEAAYNNPEIIAVSLDGDVLDYFDISLKTFTTLVPLVKRSMKLSKQLLLQGQNSTESNVHNVLIKRVNSYKYLSLASWITDSDRNNAAITNNSTISHSSGVQSTTVRVVNVMDWAKLHNFIFYSSDQTLYDTISGSLMASYFTQTYPHVGIIFSGAAEQQQVLPLILPTVGVPYDVNDTNEQMNKGCKGLCSYKEGVHSKFYTAPLRNNINNNNNDNNNKIDDSVMGIGTYLSIEEKLFVEMQHNDIRKKRGQLELTNAFNAVLKRIMLSICAHIAVNKGNFQKRYVDEVYVVNEGHQSNDLTHEEYSIFDEDILYISVPLSACVGCETTTARTIRINVSGMYSQGWCPLSKVIGEHSSGYGPQRANVIEEKNDKFTFASNHFRSPQRDRKRNTKNDHDIHDLLELHGRTNDIYKGNDESHNPLKEGSQLISRLSVQKELLPPLFILREFLKRATLGEYSPSSSFEQFSQASYTRGATVTSVIKDMERRLQEKREGTTKKTPAEDDNVYVHKTSDKIVSKSMTSADEEKRKVTTETSDLTNAKSLKYLMTSFFIKGIAHKDSFILYELLRSYNFEVLRHQIGESQLTMFPSSFAKSLAIESLTTTLITVESSSNYAWTASCQRCSGFAIEMVQFFIPLSQSTNFFHSCGDVTCFCPGYDRTTQSVLSRVHVPSLLVPEFTFPGAAGAERQHRHNPSCVSMDGLPYSKRSHAGLRSTTGANILVLHMAPTEMYNFIFSNGYKHRFDYFICRSMFEMNKVPRTWLEPSNTICDEIWVPALFVKKAFEISGIASDKLVIIHEGMDTNLYDPATVKPYENLYGSNSEIDRWRKWCNRPLRNTDTNGDNIGNVDNNNVKGRPLYRFFSNFKWEPRKGWDTLFEAYYTAFRANTAESMDNIRNATDEVTFPPDEVTLLIITRMFPENRYDPFGTKSITEQIDQDARKKKLPGYKGLQHQSYPHFCIVTELLSEEEITRLYRSFDAFVLPTRGEGWGLPLQMAMAMGLPTIGTNWGGNTEFMTEETSFLIDIDKEEEVNPDTYPVPIEDRMTLAVPSVSHLIRHMTFVVHNADEARRIGRRAREHIVTHFNQKTVADSVRMRLATIAQKLSSKANSDLGDLQCDDNIRNSNTVIDTHITVSPCKGDVCPGLGTEVYSKVHGVPELLMRW